jgi:DNA replication protein DnaC
MNEHRYEHLQAILERLKLTRVPERLDQLAEEAAKESWTYVEFLDRVLDVEVSARVERDVTMKTRLARFPFVKTLDQFDFSFQPALNEAQIRELATARFVARAGKHFAARPAGRWENASCGEPWGSRDHARDQCRLFHGC